VVFSKFFALSFISTANSGRVSKNCSKFIY